jgi:hypothetical protein
MKVIGSDAPAPRGLYIRPLPVGTRAKGWGYEPNNNASQIAGVFTLSLGEARWLLL